MAQEQPSAPQAGNKTRYLIPGGYYEERPDGNLVFVPTGTAPNKALLNQPTSPPPTGKQVEGPEFLQELLKGLTFASSFTPQGLAPGLAGKAIPIMAPMLAGALEGAVDPERTALSEAALQGGMELGGRTLAPALHYGGARLGVALGGLGKNLREHAPDIAAAVTRLKTAATPNDPLSYLIDMVRGKMPGSPLGSAKGTAHGIEEVGQKIAQFGEKRPEMINLQDLQGSSSGLARDALYTAKPEDLAKRLGSQEADIIQQHIGARNMQPIAPTGPNPNVTFREAQKIKSGLSSAASDVYQRAAQPGWDPASVIPDAKQLAALAKRMKELEERALAGHPTDLAELKQLNSLFADLKLKEAAERSMRGGGNVIGDVGQMSVRGGLSGAVGGGLAGALGGDPRTWGLTGGLAGMTLLNPKASSLLGFYSGDVARAAPGIMRGLDVINEGEKRQVRRRRPGEP